MDHDAKLNMWIECDHPESGMILGAILCIFALVFVLHLVAQSESGLPAIFFYFGMMTAQPFEIAHFVDAVIVQMCMLMLPPSSAWLRWIGIFSGTASMAVFGICIAPLTAGQEMILAACSIIIFWTALIIILIIQLILGSFRCCHDRVQRWCYAPHRYWRSVLDIYLFGYSTMVTTLIGYMSCVPVGITERVIFTAPTISCNDVMYTAWLVPVVTIFIVMVIIPPIAFIIFLRLHQTRFTYDHFKAKFGVLYEAFQPSSYWYAPLRSFAVHHCNKLGPLRQ